MNIKIIENIVKNRTAEPLKPHNYYGVMLPLIQQGEKLSVLFEVRSNNLLMQPGEVCFPGGRKEEGESHQECAIRETCEELCLNPDDIDLIGAIDYLNAYNNFTLYPFVGQIKCKDIDNITFNHDEVQEVFLVPLDFFLENDPMSFTLPIAPQIPKDFPYELISTKGSYSWRQGESIVPIYKYGSRTIWGLTARIVCNFSQLLREELK